MTIQKDGSPINSLQPETERYIEVLRDVEEK